MGIRFYCPNGHKLNVKSFLAGQKGICPYCGVKVDIPTESTRSPGKRQADEATQAASTGAATSAMASTATEEAAEMPVLDLQAAVPTPPSMPHSAPKAAGPSIPTLDAPAARTSSPSPFLGSAASAATAPLPAAGAPLPYALPTVPAAAPPPPPPAHGSPPDPLTEAPEAVWYVRPPSGGQFGPASSSVMRGWLQEGRISADSLVWREGWRDWQEAIGVFPQLRGDDVALLNAVIGSAVPAVAAAPVAIAAGHHHRPTPRQRTNTPRFLVVAALVVIVMFLFVVLLWVLWHEPAESPSEKTPEPPAAHKTALEPGAVHASFSFVSDTETVFRHAGRSEGPRRGVSPWFFATFKMTRGGGGLSATETS